MNGEFSKQELDKRRQPDDIYANVDFTAVKNGGELLNMCNDNGLAWATAFKQYTKKTFDIDLDLMYLLGWFCNAIEHSHDYREQQKAADEEYNSRYRD